MLYGNACDISRVKLSHWNPPWLILVIFCRLSSPMANFYPPFLSIPSCFLVIYKKKTEGLEKSGINRSLVKHTIEWFSQFPYFIQNLCKSKIREVEWEGVGQSKKGNCDCINAWRANIKRLPTCIINLYSHPHPHPIIFH